MATSPVRLPVSGPQFRRVNAFVLVTDMRRSRETLDAARSIVDFARFTHELEVRSRVVVRRWGGVCDGCTGDGILAVFPVTKLGESAGLHALLAAADCHDAYDAVFANHLTSFRTVLDDFGLGIGIDYGEVALIYDHDHEIVTTKGYPTHGAVDMSSAPRGETYLNNRARWKLGAFAAAAWFEEVIVDCKRKGGVKAYRVVASRAMLAHEQQRRKR